MAVVNKWENVCRLCSEEKIEMLPIFGIEGVRRKVVQKLRACLPVLVYKTDPLPKQICQFCAARLDDIYEFREYCLNVYKDMHVKLLTYKDVESVKIYFDAMKNSPDPCQAQLCTEKVRAPPPLVPLPSLLPFESSMSTDVNQEQSSNCCIETLSELPCEVEIEEVNSETFFGDETCGSTDSRTLSDNEFYLIANKQLDFNVFEHMENDNDFSKEEFGIKKEEKRTSILEQVLTGSLTMNDRMELKGREHLTSEWWCTPCNSYYKTRESLMKHMQFHCPRKYKCRKCPMSFELVEDLAKHEGTNHLKVTLDFDEIVKECHQCDRKFVSWEMLKQHRMRDHLGESIAIGMNTWCSSCNRFFPTIEAYHNHQQLHQNNNHSMAQAQQLSMQSSKFSIFGLGDPLQEIKKEYSSENTKSLTCPTCGKVCTQQSALSNHMRTHEPKRYKCDICGRSFGLFIRLAAHRKSEHDQQIPMSPLMASVEQEEALNAAREAREAREACSRGRVRTYSEAFVQNDILNSVDSSAKQNASMHSLQTSGVNKNVSRCGICLQWFDDYTTMMVHLRTHPEFYTCKNFTCPICKISFKEKWQLFRHEVSHNRTDTSYTCNVCSRIFLEKSLLKIHEKTHVVDKTHHCSKCNKLFFKEISLLAHQCTGAPLHRKRDLISKSTQKSVLQNTKRYKCSKCNASFNNLQSRKRHMRTHTESINTAVRARQAAIKKEPESDLMPELKPETSLEYIVPPIEPKVEINEETTTPPPLKRTLIRTSVGYRCGFCQSPFVLRELAIAHLKSAHPVMPYQCPYCTKRFTTKYTFTHHIKTDHPEEPEN